MRRIADWIVAFALVAACSPTTSRTRADTADAPRSDRTEAPVWNYHVRANAGGEELEVLGEFPRGTPSALTIGGRVRPFVDGLEVARGGAWTTVPERSGVWNPADEDSSFRVRYRLRLGDAARAIDRAGVAQAHGGAIESPPSTWLVRPLTHAPGDRIRFDVVSAPGEAFVTGIHSLSGESGAARTWEASADDLGLLPFSAFGKLRVHEAEAGRLVVAFLPGELHHEEDVLAWTRSSANVVEGYFGRLPVAPLLVLVRPARGKRVGMGTTMGNSGASIAITVGAGVGRAELDRDWVLVHEIIHTGLPNLAEEHHWFEEGLATYAEPLARAQAGRITPEALWSEWVRRMPDGIPGAGEGGLDGTRSWGRTYWGGALYFLLADLEIRRRTEGRKSLREALRGIVAAGGDISVSWPIERVLAEGDRATGVPVLRELYDRMGSEAFPVDLEGMWERLGVRMRAGEVVFDDSAPEAELRRRFTQP